MPGILKAWIAEQDALVAKIVAEQVKQAEPTKKEPKQRSRKNDRSK